LHKSSSFLHGGITVRNVRNVLNPRIIRRRNSSGITQDPRRNRHERADNPATESTFAQENLKSLNPSETVGKPPLGHQQTLGYSPGREQEGTIITIMS